MNDSKVVNGTKCRDLIWNFYLYLLGLRRLRMDLNMDRYINHVVKLIKKVSKKK